MFRWIGDKRMLILLTMVALIVGFGRVALAGQTPQETQADNSTAVGTPQDAAIPAQALRLRIIANSNSAADQQLKREVRDAIVLKVAGMVKNARTMGQAKAIVTAHLGTLQALAQQVVDQHGFRYDVRAEVGKVPFPTKEYGNRIYPAGEYEALRLVIGKGAGQNWWCVLFPPLCFVDIADGDAVPNTAGFPDLPPLETLSVPNVNGSQSQVQVRMATLDYGEEFWKTIRSWMHG